MLCKEHISVCIKLITKGLTNKNKNKAKGNLKKARTNYSIENFRVCLNFTRVSFESFFRGYFSVFYEKDSKLSDEEKREITL